MFFLVELLDLIINVELVECYYSDSCIEVFAGLNEIKNCELGIGIYRALCFQLFRYLDYVLIIGYIPEFG